jgi:hypothetical protein
MKIRWKMWAWISVLVLLCVPEVFAWPFPDTGQTKCYNDFVEISCPAPGQPFYGQDAQYQGPNRSYTKLGQNAVALSDSATQESGWLMTRDNVTGLIWEMKTDDGGIHDKGNTYTWCDKNSTAQGGYQGTCGTGTGNAATDTEAFIKAINDAQFGGFSDWRMPTIKELSSLVNSGINNPASDTAWFPNATWSCWSSTAYAGLLGRAWPVDFGRGYVGIYYMASGYCARAVRADNVASAALVDNGDGTVTDTGSGLMWQKATPPGTYKWQNALSYCENLSFAGYSDWRLPNRNELQSLVDYSRYNPAIDPLLASNTVPYNYWSSTTYTGSMDFVWLVYFGSGNVGYEPRTGSYEMRCVRSGQSGLFGNLVILKSGGGSGTVSSSPAGIACGATCSNYFIKGASINLTATPDPGSIFAIWSGGVCSGTSTTCQVTMEGDKTVTATFATAGTALYFPHIATSLPWQTEIAIINTSPDQTINGALRSFSDEGQLVETKTVTLSAHGRRQITVADEFSNHTNIGYITFDTDSATVQGYTKFYREGYYRAAIPAVKEVNTSDIYISHIASSTDWWTGVSLVNTTSATKVLTITFNNGHSVPYTLNANQHRAFDIAQEFFNNQPQPGIQSAVITNASGIIGLELFGNNGGNNHLDGILLTDNTASTIYYPHVASDDIWWTGIVAYNPSELACTITITPYSATGTPLSPSTLPIAGKGKYIGAVSQLGLPAQTAWFKIDSTTPLSGFELFGTTDGNQLAAYAGSGGTGAKTGVFAKIEKNGWTGIAFVNTEDSAASVTLTAYNDNGTAVATQVLPVGGHAKVVNLAEAIFPQQDISGATYIAYSSDRNVVGFQLNGSSDGMMLDGLPGLGGTN